MQIDINYDNGLSDIANNIENNFADIIGQGAQTVCESAKSLCPVDTGRLQSSINVQPGGNTAVISADTEYAVFVEFGTSKNGGTAVSCAGTFIKHASNIVCNRRGDKGVII